MDPEEGNLDKGQLTEARTSIEIVTPYELARKSLEFQQRANRTCLSLPKFQKAVKEIAGTGDLAIGTFVYEDVRFDLDGKPCLVSFDGRELTIGLGEDEYCSISLANINGNSGSGEGYEEPKIDYMGPNAPTTPGFRKNWTVNTRFGVDRVEEIIQKLESKQ